MKDDRSFSYSTRAVLPEGTPSVTDTADTLAFIAALELTTQCIDLLVRLPANRRKRENVRFHVWSSNLPRRSFVRWEQGVYLSSPEFLFLQMAKHLSLHKLIELGFELCGTYSLSKGARRGFVNRDPLTNKQRISDYLATCPPCKGLKKARRAVQYIENGSASPMETILAMMLCLPPRMGGYGFPPVSMNREIEMTLAGADGIEKRRTVRCDLSWPDCSLAIEYESDEEHLSSYKFSQDSIRRNDLTSSNITVITVTKRQLINRAHWPDLAGRIASLMGKRINIRSAHHIEAQRELYAQLLGRLSSR